MPRLIDVCTPVLIALTTQLGTGCGEGGWYASARTGSRITPKYFKFAEIVPEGDAGGWRAVCIVAKVGQRLKTPQGANFDAEDQCEIEVGVPISNIFEGYIPIERAQRIAADVANDAAYRVLERSPGVIGVVCRGIIREMNRLLKRKIRGSEVASCGATLSKKPVPRVYWP